MGVVLGIKEDGDKGPIRVDNEGRLYITSNVGAPVSVIPAAGTSFVVDAQEGTAQTHDVTKSKSITKTSQNLKLPEKNGLYLLIARGNDAFIEAADGSAPTVTASAGGFTVPVMDGMALKLRLSGDYIAWIGATAGGTLSIIHIRS